MKRLGLGTKAHFSSDLFAQRSNWLVNLVSRLDGLGLPKKPMRYVG